MAVEEELRESDEKYRMLLDGVRDYAIFMMDPQGDVLSWNAGAERTKGYSAGEILGRNFALFFPPEEVGRGRPEELLRMTAASGRHEEQAMRVRRDGSQFLAHVTLAALHDRAGELRGFSEISHDLGESKASEARYRGLLEAAPDAMVVVNTGGEIVLLNVQAEKQFGYRRDELLGQPVKRLIPEGFAERLIADGTRTAAEALAQQIGTGIELIGRRKDGSSFPIEIMLSPLEGVEGILVTAAIRDISVRKAAEEHLAQMEGSYRGLLEAAPDAMVVVNTGGEIVLLNVQAEKQFGYHRDELARAAGEEHHSGGLRRAPDRRRAALGRGGAGAADRHRDRALGPAEGRHGVSDRDHALAARGRRGDPGDGGDPRHQHAQGGRSAAAAEGGGAQALERGAGAVRLHRLARPAGAAADGGQLHAAAVAALQGQARLRRRRVHRLRGGRRQPDAAADPGPAGLFAGRDEGQGTERDLQRRAPGPGAGRTCVAPSRRAEPW